MDGFGTPGVDWVAGAFGKGSVAGCIAGSGAGSTGLLSVGSAGASEAVRRVDIIVRSVVAGTKWCL